MEGIPAIAKKPPAFGRRSKPGSGVNSRGASVDLTHPDIGIEKASPDTCTPRSSFSSPLSSSPSPAVAPPASLHSLLSFIASQDDEPHPSPAAALTEERAPALPSPPFSTPSPSSSSSTPHWRPFSSTAALPSTPSSPSPASSSPPQSSAFSAYQSRLTSLTSTIASLRTQLSSATAEHQSAQSALSARYESALSAQLSFIEGLVADKQRLVGEVEAGEKERKALEERAMERCVDLQLQCDARAKVDLERAKKEWREKETKLIKASLLRSMQAELATTLQHEKDAREALAQQHHAALRTALAEADRVSNTLQHDLRQDLSVQHERQLQRESTKHAESTQALLERFERREDDLRRLHREELDQQRKIHQDEKTHLATTHQRDLDRAEAEFAKREKRSEMLHQERLTSLQSSADEQLRIALLTKDADNDEALRVAEANMKQRLTKENEAELAHVIERLGQETVQMSLQDSKKHQAAMAELERNFAQHRERETKRAEDLSRQIADFTKQRDVAAKDQRKLEEELRTTTKQLDTAVADLEDRKARETRDRGRAAEGVDELRAEIRELKAQFEDSKKKMLASHREEIERREREAEDVRQREMRDLKRRVEDITRKKDDIIMGLQRDLRTMQSQALSIQNL